MSRARVSGSSGARVPSGGWVPRVSGGRRPSLRRPLPPHRRLLARAAGLAEGCLTGGQARGRDAERRAGDVVEPDLVAEAHRVGVAAVLAADAEVQVLPGGAALLAGQLHQPADARLVDGHEGVGGPQLALLVHAEELADVVAREAEGRLSQVVGAEREELGHLGDLTGGQRGSWKFDHRVPRHLQFYPGLGGHLGGYWL